MCVCLFVVLLILFVVVVGNLLFVLVGSGALPLWARKAPPLVAPPTYTNPAGGGVGGRGHGGAPAPSTSANTHTLCVDYKCMDRKLNGIS